MNAFDNAALRASTEQLLAATQQLRDWQIQQLKSTVEQSTSWSQQLLSGVEASQRAAMQSTRSVLDAFAPQDDAG